MGAMRCMGPTDTSPLKLQGEVGGCPWLSGVRRCVGRKTHTHLFDKPGSVYHCL